jgi:hypothetical protein
MALTALEVDQDGLDEMDNRILLTIVEKFKGGPVGLSTIATAVGEEAETIEEVYEPFLIQEHFDLLQTLVDQGVAGQVEIHYNTNGTQYPKHAESIWRHFKHVEIAFSIDDVEQRFEYQRTNAKWAEVIANIDRFKQLRTRSSNITLQVCCTINVFNVLYLADVAHWIYKQDFDYVYWNMLHDAPWLSIAHLPTDAKATIANHLSAHSFPSEYQIEIQKIVEFMNLGTSTDGKDLLKNIQQLDDRRNESLHIVAPKLANILNYD